MKTKKKKTLYIYWKDYVLLGIAMKDWPDPEFYNISPRIPLAVCLEESLSNPLILVLVVKWSLPETENNILEF